MARFRRGQQQKFPSLWAGLPENVEQFLECSLRTKHVCSIWKAFVGAMICVSAIGVAGEPYRASRSRLMCRACWYSSTVSREPFLTRLALREGLVAAAWYVTTKNMA